MGKVMAGFNFNFNQTFFCFDKFFYLFSQLSTTLPSFISDAASIFALISFSIRKLYIFSIFLPQPPSLLLFFYCCSADLPCR